MGAIVSTCAFPDVKSSYEPDDVDGLVFIPLGDKKHPDYQIAVKPLLKPGVNYTIIYSHGNAEDIGQLGTVSTFLSIELKCNVIVYDYPGYGLSSGKPSDKSLCMAALAVYRYATNTLKIPPESIISYGRSIGSVAATHIAFTHKNVAGLVLQSPLASAYRVVFKVKSTLLFDQFRNVDKVKTITTPVLIIHGRKDQIIPFHNAETLLANSPTAVTPLFLDNARHNNILSHFCVDLMLRLKRFVQFEIRKYSHSYTVTVPPQEIGLGRMGPSHISSSSFVGERRRLTDHSRRTTYTPASTLATGKDSESEEDEDIIASRMKFGKKNKKRDKMKESDVEEGVPTAAVLAAEKVALAHSSRSSTTADGESSTYLVEREEDSF
ncbi:Protein of unknown function DUF818 like protein [Aduncisulcus paluster]|uniref:Serine aminopeptidase S33 domain-containing protein n=1 Tax=Aduncisulcus paluster TaxID=2918883 RepID=A0ABQ5KWT5_9EUKA|nr:Protein of unknown function DUF818 like protein [Aduncisulcus paluster]